jgi:hypothetical protein
MNIENKEPKKPGRIPGNATVKATILIEPDLLEWGKRQPGGLSDTIRKALKEIRQKEQTEN